ncbi:VOC family protein [Derxia lacustris]|uniref:VOC family protein n=1 Tax=Derxia lacustris TaxID=764842 RepID=UPI000A172663|nr:VOC family protein [Derxia lacustris]
MPANPFVWYELMTTDTAAATAFYQAVLGWSARDSGAGEVDYTVLGVGDRPLGGLMQLPAEAAARGARPGWLGYIGCDDVDAAVARLAEAGGKVHRPAWSIPGVGRLAVVADPQGAAFVLFRGESAEAPPAPEAGSPGSVGWHELQAVERESAFAFYSAQFGWTADTAVDMGPLGTYQIFAIDDKPAGGVMNKLPALPVPFWIYYFCVADIDAAIARVNAAQGSIVNGPNPVPGGSWIAHGIDPQGALFALVGMRSAN